MPPVTASEAGRGQRENLAGALRRPELCASDRASGNQPTKVLWNEPPERVRAP